jgi:hypothetical protein
MARGRRTKENSVPGDAAASGNGSERASGQSQERIAARAYELYLARGGTDGQDWEDWLAAERELSSRPPGSEPTE